MLFGQDGLPIPAESVIRRIGDLLHCGVFAMKLANNSVVVLVCESRLQLIMMPSEHQRIIWVLTNLLHKVGSWGAGGRIRIDTFTNDCLQSGWESVWNLKWTKVLLSGSCCRWRQHRKKLMKISKECQKAVVIFIPLLKEGEVKLLLVFGTLYFF